MMIGTLDLSSVTDRLLDLLQAAIDTAPLWTVNGGHIEQFTITLSGAMPEAVRSRGDCQLTVYLFHLSAEPFTRNMPLTGSVAQPNVRQALGLTLYYLVSAFAKDHPEQEQQAMSIAIKALHERGTYVDSNDDFTFTITLEAEKLDEANRRWQSFSTPFRLSAVCRVAVIFLTPSAQPPQPAASPRRLGLSVGPAGLPFGKGAALVASQSRVEFTPFPPQPDGIIFHEFSPALAQPGGSFSIFGRNLTQPTAQRVYLMEPAGTEREVTTWRAAPAEQTASRLVMKLPDAVASPPVGSPEPGVYLMRVGSELVLGDASDFRSNAVAVTITARTDPPPSPWVPIGGVFVLAGAGFVAGATELLIDTVPLTAIAAGSTPSPGQFAPNASGTSIAFLPPVSLPEGDYVVRLRVMGTEGPPPGRISVS